MFCPLYESQEEYQTRILKLVSGNHCLPEHPQDFSTAVSLREKVMPDGSFAPFYGDTLIYMLEGSCQRKVSQLRDQMYQAAGDRDLFAKPLHPNCFHVTLHDLVSGPRLELLSGQMAENQKYWECQIGQIWDIGNFTMRPAGLVNMVSKSVVLLLIPETEGDYARMRQAYEIADETVRQSYPYTAHITLAYYKNGVYSWEQWKRLLEFMKAVDVSNMRISMKAENLHYMTFEDMNHYSSILNSSLG